MSNPDFALAESVSTTNASYFIAIYILVLIYCCFGLAIVCDAYFVPALQKLSYTYNLPPDIAGSTLMALGASVPELFASLIGVFVTEDDIGTGSIIGSSCFNLIAVPAACAFVASATFSQKLVVSPVPVMRNSAFYAITILVLLLIIKDNKVDIPEALILLMFFVMYMAFMIFCAQSKRSVDDTGGQHQPSSLTSSYVSNDSAIAECARTGGKRSQVSDGAQLIYGQYYFTNNTMTHNNQKRVDDQSANERTPLVQVSNKSCEILVDAPRLASLYPKCDQVYMSEPNLLDTISIDLGVPIKNSTCLVRNVESQMNSCEYTNLQQHQQQQHQQQHHDESGWLHSNWVLLPMFPLTLSMALLAPLKFKNTCWTVWTFIVSICLIGGLTYVSVWMVHLFGQAMGIPETVAGMTILSWGTGIPELIASIVLIKKTAQADMAICNTIGSNVIDASFCLSVPWLVKCMMNKSQGLQPDVYIQSAALPWTSFTLFLSVVLLILILKFNNWELSCSVGMWLTVTYVTFVGCATYLESSFSRSGLDLLSMI